MIRVQHLAVLAAFLGWLGYCLAAIPASAQTPSPLSQPTPVTTDAHNSLQLGFHVSQADALHLAAARDAGGRFIVFVFNWANIEPEPGYLYWEQPDAAVRAARFYGLELIARLDQPPAWALQSDQPLPFDRDAYTNFARRVAERYGDGLAGVILWNEPNLNLEWNNQPPNAAAYVDLLKAAYPVIKSVAPNLPVALAGLASTEGEGDWAINDLDYLQAIYEAGGSAYFDVLTAHPYGFGRPPDDPPGQYHPNFRRLELYRELMVAYGDAAKPVWVTEAGWLVRTSNPKYRWQIVTPRQQADTLLGAVSYAQAHYPWLERLGLWQLNRRGDPYGYDLWSGPAQWSLAYRALVQSCRSRNCDSAVPTQPHPQEVSDPNVTILAPDVAIRLGDREALQPQWVHLYHNQSGSSLAWQGEFYLTQAQTQGAFDLLLETMLVGQSNDRVVLNGQDLAYLYARPRPDATSTWVTQRLAVPAGFLRAGVNHLKVVAGPRNPARQYVAGRWENFQFRHIRLEPASPLPAPLLANWQLQPSPSGWSETNRLRLGVSGDLWLTGSRPGEIWRLAAASTGLVNQAGNRPNLVFNDVLPLTQGELAATQQGLFWRPRQRNDWQPVITAPAAMTYVVARANGRFYAGLEGEGLGEAPAPTGPWQRVPLTATTVLDLATQRYTLPGQPSPVERLYASSATELWQNDGLDEHWQELSLPGLTQAELDQAGESPGDKFRSRLFVTSQGRIVLRVQDRLWQESQAGWELVGPEEVAGNLLTAWECCTPDVWVGSNKKGLWGLTPTNRWQRLDDGFFDTTDLTDLRQVNGRFYAAGELGLFESVNGKSWQKVEGLSSVITDLVVDPTEPPRWLAATPAGLYRSRDSGQSWAAISPPWTVWDLAWGPQGRLFVGRANGLVWADDMAAESVAWQEAEGMNKVAFLRVRPHPGEPQTVWSGAWGNNIAVSDDGGREVEPLHHGLETLTGLDILWLPRQGQILLGTGEGLYRTEDGGQSWSRLPGPLSQQTVYALFQSVQGTIWAGAADGLWLSQDGGDTWRKMTNLPNMTVLRLEGLTLPTPPLIPFRHGLLVYTPARWLWAGTEGAGLWVSRDEGVTWSFAGLPGRTVYNLQFQQDLLAATDRGIWAVAIPPGLLGENLGR